MEIPPGTGFVGINSMVRHSVAGNAYGNVRIGAFMGKKIINEIRATTGRAALNYLTEISSEEFKAEFQSQIPETILGSDFLSKYKTHDDPVTTMQPDATYRVAGPTRHPIGENERVLKFIAALNAAKTGDEQALVTAGELMYAAHESYRDNCRLSVPEVNFLVEAVRKRGPESGSLRRENHRRRHRRHRGRLRQNRGAQGAHSADRHRIFAPRRRNAGHF